MAVLRRRSVLTILAALVFAVGLARAADKAAKHSADSAVFAEAAYLRDVSFLASDEQEGRGTGQPGNDRAAEYIANQYREAGLKPAGDHGTFFQNFTLKLHTRIGEKNRLAYAERGRRTYRTAAPKTDYVPFPFSANGPFDGEVVFAGYGIIDDDYNEYDGLDVADKVVLLIRRGPKFGEFSPRQMSFQAKAQRANARDAAAILIVNPMGDEEGDTLYSMDTVGAGPNLAPSSYGIPMMHITHALADEFLSGGLGDLAAVQARIEKDKKPASAPLKGVTVKGFADVEKIDAPARNVVGMIPGTGPNKDEIIVIGGHYDHLGIRHKGEPGFNPLKDISNGADDNASGSTGVMMLARAYAQRPPNRTIVAMAFTGEELGLLGSADFAKNPTIDLKKCVAMLNFDMIGRLKDDKLEVGGMKTGGFEEMVKRLAVPYHLNIADGGGGRGPSDHTSFYNKNIPVLFFFTGLHKQYHQPEDDVPLLNIEGAVRVAKFAADVIDEIDASPKAPVFVSDSRRPTIAMQDATPAEPTLAGPARPRGPRLGIVPDEDGEPGVLIADVQDGTPAARAGMKEGDRIVKVGDAKVGDVGALITALGGFKSGDKTTVVVKRGGKERSINVTLDEARPVAQGREGDAGASMERAPAKRAEPKSPTKAPVAKAAAAKPASGASDTTRSVTDVVRALIDVNAAGNGDRRPTLAFRVDGHDFVISAQAEKPKDGDGWHVVGSVDDVLHAATDFIKDGGKNWSVKTEMTIGRDAKTRIRLQFGGGAGSAHGEMSVGRDHAPEAAESQEKHGAAGASKGPSQKPKGNADSHGGLRGDDDGDEAAPRMPPVRLGIMPTYGQPEGEGFEISGVTPNGPAAKAGMKDSDRICRIGKLKVIDVHSYMAALQDHKPGDVIEVDVLREGKHVVLKLKCEAQKAVQPS